ncbi:bifunctional 3-(3-hydroxy-phenyl)propionate/3-hydroxycinnamic acid hydroxylase [Shimwellia blattae]|uniref:3-(3-hydroxy-phenyl)propionate/3-hydroxycinnamic acid hydroxylase n=1 Tax=Shimwellia blattae (strain ATCC 29907 / DSM 4481 / JCM 1650 / NBRC 105725 / CDC 9005-74) TaxID=630626 RepID=I2B991_SHIBC|nr:bifunctional 3-(3-hydroxy-phenyl)propionate/3-hydroxycinnamic acid hydroxylase [Shimwellia blattae]AFJ47095.1 3-(3-hydroxy-phenyl)propionate hydroxylase [Shimwellia blattae DSM 4481 = NBRC 105725]GAB80784.1 3-(3-hydroxy-phenyl)propionate/3-hydroxycinnamic acid hydroxylase [Shimwellia blattae DSM 4481 = NBRC 105725]VDY64587.1 3-(3-hydroxy-phenyl)propionate/3-hydroxycinnamic acid hydroxylase [Shimwellia blattae]VEC22695.1 3-(3-hydroxy-phenyl)propionate/3-hydroxycinnamic acid hydroxylase [Shimw
MTTTRPDLQAVTQSHTQVAILGAGPVGLMMANYLGQMGVEVVICEKLDTLIDYPRAIGIDDESLRTMQSVGLAEQVLPHTTPWHAMRFLTPKGRCFADIQPMTDEFGWSRRNAFIQPQVDAVMFKGLARFPNVSWRFSRELESFSQQPDGVTLNLKTPSGSREILHADWLVACDGGASTVRRTLNIPFEGKTAPNQWIVIDIANDPLGTPHIYLCCDPVRPYVSAALPHGIRRFEFMVMPGETEEQLRKPGPMRQLLSKVLPDPDNVELIRQRVYTHNARLAERFRVDRILLAGDAAHIMPVWQGQGYNSGMRDAFNLAWKLAMVVQGKARAGLLDTYQQERRDHARAMIDLSVMAGNVLAPPKRWHGVVRDGVTRVLNYLPPVKRYFLEMRFKPMPRYTRGALVAAEGQKNSPVGTMFIQPRVTLEGGEVVRLDEVIGPCFAILAWGNNPCWGLTKSQIAQWQALGCVFINVVAEVQIHQPQDNHPGVIRLGDTQNRIKTWFASQSDSVVVLRPDRFVALTAIPQTLAKKLTSLSCALQLITPVAAHTTPQTTAETEVA